MSPHPSLDVSRFASVCLLLSIPNLLPNDVQNQDKNIYIVKALESKSSSGMVVSHMMTDASRE